MKKLKILFTSILMSIETFLISVQYNPITVKAVDWIDDTPENTKGFKKLTSGIKQQTASLFDVLIAVAFSLAGFAIYKIAIKFFGNSEKRAEGKQEMPGVFFVIMFLIGLFTVLGIAKTLGESLFVSN